MSQPQSNNEIVNQVTEMLAGQMDIHTGLQMLDQILAQYDFGEDEQDIVEALRMIRNGALHSQDKMIDAISVNRLLRTQLNKYEKPEGDDVA